MIDDVEFPSHFERFRTVVNEVLPLLGFPDERRAQFVANNSALYQDVVFEVECRDAQTAYCRREGWSIVYIIPSDWSARRAIADQSIQEITRWYEGQPEDQPPLRMNVSDQSPFLEAYFGAFLPSAG